MKSNTAASGLEIEHFIKCGFIFGVKVNTNVLIVVISYEILLKEVLTPNFKYTFRLLCGNAICPHNTHLIT